MNKLELLKMNQKAKNLLTELTYDCIWIYKISI